MRRWQLWAMSAVLLCALVGLVLAQAGGGQPPAGGGAGAAGGGGRGGGRGGGGGFGGRTMTDAERATFLQTRVDRLKETLGATDEEWNVLKDAITAVVNLGGDQMKASQTLREVVAKEGATNDELKAALDTYRKATKAVTDKRPALQAKLKEIVTPKQEAQLVLQGILD